LFGLRVDDDIRGGDIGPFVETRQTLENRLNAPLNMNAKLILRLGAGKIAVIVADSATPMEPIHQIAKSQGIRL
jgi:hypothetical protein